MSNLSWKEMHLEIPLVNVLIFISGIIIRLNVNKSDARYITKNGIVYLTLHLEGTEMDEIRP